MPKFYFKTLPNSKSIDSMGLFHPDNPSDPKEFYWTVAGTHDKYKILNIFAL